MQFQKFKDEIWWCITALREAGRTEDAIDNFTQELYNWGDLALKPVQPINRFEPSSNILRLFSRLEVLEAKAEASNEQGLICLINNIRVCMQWWQQQQEH